MSFYILANTWKTLIPSKLTFMMFQLAKPWSLWCRYVFIIMLCLMIWYVSIALIFLECCLFHIVKVNPIIIIRHYLLCSHVWEAIYWWHHINSSILRPINFDFMSSFIIWRNRQNLSFDVCYGAAFSPKQVTVASSFFGNWANIMHWNSYSVYHIQL